ncbi:hypothetical protein SMB34_01330 [Thalassospira permensis NBRC 106175]|uniref:Uncharacterized protein n=1 Tax=Thalassospira permensis NBRC 106175 TaxID=1353532 RepID=A0ABR4TUA6_9PROT|nr:hypothetical protein SMB34_01330 [Thalassospira permensis NBRC 106175]
MRYCLPAAGNDFETLWVHDGCLVMRATKP